MRMFLASFAALATAGATAPTSAAPALDVRFAPRVVTRIEVGDFHFLPGQKAPIHTHAAPAYGYVSKGAILYHVEGRKPVILKAGDAFFEPVGPRILKFDNASPTEEAVFTDWNPERDGDPFIVFPKPPTEKIDRRSFPTVAGTGAVASRVTLQALALTADKPRTIIAGDLPVTGYVALGRVILTTTAGRESFAAGTSFAVPANSRGEIAAEGGAARAVTFTLSR